MTKPSEENAEKRRKPIAAAIERIGGEGVTALDELGAIVRLLGAALEATFVAPFRGRRGTRIEAVAQRVAETGISAVPIVTLLSATIGIMLAIQGIHSLRPFGAENRVILGAALSIVREFAPLITGIIVAGRTGSAIAARFGTMRINREIDSLVAMGVPIERYLVAPVLIASLIVTPILAIIADVVALAAAGAYVSAELGIGIGAYATEVMDSLAVSDLAHGLWKALLFGLLVALVGASNGLRTDGGAESVGTATTRAVVHSIAAIVVTDMIFVLAVTR
jgi:phospholipid/cholesterol/gamma-HCH transport system permease protein